MIIWAWVQRTAFVQIISADRLVRRDTISLKPSSMTDRLPYSPNLPHQAARIPGWSLATQPVRVIGA